MKGGRTVIFDTNAYRTFASGPAEAVRERTAALRERETRLCYPTELTDEQWNEIAKYVPAAKPEEGHRSMNGVIS